MRKTIGTLVAVASLLVAFLSWQFPKALRESQQGPQPVTTTLPPPPTSDTIPPGGDPNPESHPPGGGVAAPPKSVTACGTLETATLRAGSPAKVASGLATLSITSGQIGSEKFLTLGINSDREARSEAVSGAPDRHDFKTSRGTYFVNIT